MNMTGLLGPLFGAAFCGLCVTAAYPSAPRSGRLPLWWALALGGVFFLGVGFMLMRFGVLSTAWFSFEGLRRVVGLLMVGLALAAAVRGSRFRARADALGQMHPEPIDSAASALIDGPRFGVFSGRIGAAGQVTSPGGVVGAFYQAEVRELTEGGDPGPLISNELGASRLLYLNGESERATLDLAAAAVAGPVQARRCVAGGRLSLAPGAVFAEGELPNDALSYERVGKLGEPCLMVGQLERGPANRLKLSASKGGQVLIVLGDDLQAVVKSLARNAWTQFMGAAALSIASACCLAGLFH